MPPDLLTPDDLSRIDSLELRATRIVEGFITGLHRSPYHGFSVEFAEHRPYNAGDDLRHVDWKVFARKDRFFVKRYEEETNLRHYTVLDTSASMRYRGQAGLSKLEYGATLSAALHTLLARQRDATGLVTFDRSVHTRVPPRATRSHLRGLFATLQRLLDAPAPEADGAQTAAADALHAVAERIPRRAFVTVISDLFENISHTDEVLRALQHLRHRGHEVLVLRLADAATEQRFEFPDRPVRFRDMETGEEVTLQPAQIRAHVQQAATAFEETLRRRCRELSVDVEFIDTARPYAEALRAVVAKRQRLY